MLESALHWSRAQRGYQLSPRDHYRCYSALSSAYFCLMSEIQFRNQMFTERATFLQYERSSLTAAITALSKVLVFVFLLKCSVSFCLDLHAVLGVYHQNCSLFIFIFQFLCLCKQLFCCLFLSIQSSFWQFRCVYLCFSLLVRFLSAPLFNFLFSSPGAYIFADLACMLLCVGLTFSSLSARP